MKYHKMSHGDFVPIIQVVDTFDRYTGAPSGKSVLIGRSIFLNDPHNIRMLIDQLKGILDEHCIDSRWRI